MDVAKITIRIRVLNFISILVQAMVAFALSLTIVFIVKSFLLGIWAWYVSTITSIILAQLSSTYRDTVLVDERYWTPSKWVEVVFAIVAVGCANTFFRMARHSELFWPMIVGFCILWVVLLYVTRWIVGWMPKIRT